MIASSTEQNTRTVRKVWTDGQVAKDKTGLLVYMITKALFSSQNFGFFATVALSFLFDKHCPITE